MAKPDKNASKAAERAKPAEPEAPPPTKVIEGIGTPYPEFDLDDPELPDEINDRALASGHFPYDSKLKRKVFEEELQQLHLELLKLQSHVEQSGLRIVAVFEGRDASGKGTCIGHFLERLNPRHARSIALTKPTETERGQWYYQRYIEHLPTRGDIVLFDRSWYNRAGVERVMGFCTPEETEAFLRDTPHFEDLLVRDGFHFFKFYLTIGREMQLKRFHERQHDPFKKWKITDIDRAAIAKWDDYTVAERAMLAATHKSKTPWTAVHANDQRRARLEVIRVVLSSLDYPGKDKKAVGTPDAKIANAPDKILKGKVHADD